MPSPSSSGKGAAEATAEAKSLLELVGSYDVTQGSEKGSLLCDDVLKWFDQYTQVGKSETEAITGNVNERGETALHVLLKRQHPGDGNDAKLIRVIEKLVDIGCESLSTQDSQGYLPLHIACKDKKCGFGVIQALINAYPAGLGVKTNGDDTTRHTPFGWDYETSLGGHFVEFVANVVKSDVCISGAKENILTPRKIQHQLLSYCKDWMPFDILERGFLNEKNLESSAMIRWLNELPCKRSIVFALMYELYLHISWICIFTYATIRHIEKDQQIQGWEPYALLLIALQFYMQELYQMYRFTMTNATIAYWMDVWNWIDLLTASLVVASAIRILQNDQTEGSDQLFITTGAFQFIHVVSYLKKTFFSFGKFVSGIIKVRSNEK